MATVRTFEHLRKLGPSNSLIAWMSGFELQTSDQIREWSAESAMAAWEALNSGSGEGGPAYHRGGGGRMQRAEQVVSAAMNLDLQTVLHMDR